MSILFRPEVREYLNEISHIMYEDAYFGYLNSSEKYMEDLINDIITTLPNREKEIAPPYFNRYAEKLLFSIFKKNKNTQWYVFFNLYDDGGELIYFIQYISNNHLVSQHL